VSAAVIERARRLLARATHAATPSEEARTSAMVLARLIVAHAIELVPAGLLDSLRSREELPLVAVRLIRSRYAGFCAVCARRYNVGDWVAWSRDLHRSAHADCAGEWRAAA
jgi:hypothetical protein